MLKINEKVSIPLAEITFTFARSSGPGGQNVNKVSSKAILRWDLSASSDIPEEAKARFARSFPSALTENGEVVIMGQRFRDAPKNRDDCLEKLRKMLEKSLIEPKKRIPTKPTKGSIRRRLEDKARRSETKARRRKVNPDD